MPDSESGCEDTTILTFKVNFLCQKSSESFQFFFSLKNMILGAQLLLKQPKSCLETHLLRKKQIYLAQSVNFDDFFSPAFLTLKFYAFIFLQKRLYTFED